MMEIALEQKNFSPGEEISGKLIWKMFATNMTCENRLIWFTEGKGTRDYRIVQKMVVELTKGDGSHDFSFNAPSWPHSFSGQFISLQWAIEVVQLPGEEGEYAELVIGPAGQETILPRLEG